MTNQKVVLRAFKIKSSSLSQYTSNIYDTLVDRLQSTVVKQRIMRLNQNDETAESDLIANYTINNVNIFGTMMRIAPGADDTYIDSQLMEKACFSLNEIHKTGQNSLTIYKNHYYICLNNNYIVTNLPRNMTIKRVEDYLNWLNNTYIYEIIPVTIDSPRLKLSDIDNIKFSHSVDSNNDKTHTQEKNQNTIINITKDYIKKVCNLLIADSNSLKDIDIERIISAQFILKVKKPFKMSNTEFQNNFGTFLKPISDLDNITLCDKNGNKITWSDILKIKNVWIEKTDKNFLSEPQLYIEMARFLEELQL